MTKFNRYLGIDYGEKRMGIAISDPFNQTALPLPFILTKYWQPEIKKLLEKYPIKAIILGLPKNLKGEDSQKTTEVREFAKTIESESQKEVIFWDERYSTSAMQKHLITADVSRKKRKQVIDSLAAQYILQGYLDKKSHSL